MRKPIQLKTSREFLKNYFPENVVISKKLSNKDKRILREKKRILRRNRKIIKKLKQYLQLRGFGVTEGDRMQPFALENKKNKSSKSSIQTRYLLSLDQIKGELFPTGGYAKPSSDYFLKIKEKKKFSLLYGGVSKRFFQKAYLEAKKERGRLVEKIVMLFETRLDILLWRICFAKTIGAARQYISHNMILVNGIKVNISSYQVQVGDIISVDTKKRKKVAARMVDILKKKINGRFYRHYLSIKYLKKNIKLIVAMDNQRLSDRASRKDHHIKKNSKIDFNFLLGNSPSLKSSGNNKKTRIFSKTKLNWITRKLHRPGKKGIRSNAGDRFHRLRTERIQNKTNPLLITRNLEKLIVQIKKRLLKKKFLRKNLLKKRFFLFRRRRYPKREWWLISILKLNLLHKLLQKISIDWNSRKYLPEKVSKEYFVPISIKSQQKVLYLKLQKLLYRKRFRSSRLRAMQISPMKPIHVEVSFRIMSAIILSSPQKMVFPTILNMDILSRSLA